MNVPIKSLQNWVRYQLGAAKAMAASVGGKVRHLKLHGAFSNMTSEDQKMALAVYEAAVGVDPDIIIMVLAATAQERAVRELGCKWAGEIFADRPYNDDATLVDRLLPGAVIHDAEIATERVVNMVREGAIITQSGKRIETRIDTICLHGDEPTAVALALGVRSGLLAAGIEVKTFEGWQG